MEFVKFNKAERDNVMKSMIGGIEIVRDSPEEIRGKAWRTKDGLVRGFTYVEQGTYRRIGIAKFIDTKGAVQQFKYSLFFPPEKYNEAAIQFVIHMNRHVGLKDFYDLGDAWKAKVGDKLAFCESEEDGDEFMV
jgi:hypothetical protein